MHRLRGLLAGLLLAVVLAPFTAGVTVAAGNTLVVDDDLAQCPNATFMSINLAVMAAAPGDTIKVCAGTYNETVTINKTLTLRGTDKASDKHCDEPTVADPTRDAIVQGGGLWTFGIQANDVVLRDFVIQNTTAGPGVYAGPAFSGYRIWDNVIQNNVFGIYFNASGATESLVEKNCIRLNNAVGAASGNGIYSDAGLHNGRIRHNEFFGNNSSAIVLTTGGAPTSTLGDVRIDNNRSIQDGSFLAIFTSANVLVEKNKVIRPTGSGIFAGMGNTGLLIKHNDMRDGSGGSGIRFNSQGGAPSTAAEVTNNDIRDFFISGISVAANSLTSSLIDRNHARDNGQDGIRISAGGNAGNLIRGNHLRDNTEHDCHDDTVGPGTAGTANTWEKNHGETENRPGLCDD